MNLTDFKRTPIHRVVEMIRREAAQQGVTISHSEVVGITPAQALVDAGAWYLQLDLEPEQVLENRLQEDESPLASPAPFLDAVASDAPAPGGGSVAALAGALAAALTTMVSRLTQGRKRYQDVAAEMAQLETEAERLRQALAARVAQDAAAYDGVVDAYRLPKETEAERAARKEAIEAAMIHAAEVPLATARDAVAALELALQAARRGNPNALTDAATAGHMAQAAFEGAALNVWINADQIADRERAAGWMDELAALRVKSEETMADVQSAIEERWTS
jgi:glutamate formiminotransferase/formiminotetrahydrofolate cyclodeaminase